jgi:AbiU2
MNTTINPLIQGSVDWLDEIERQLIELFVGRDVYREVLDMYARNPEIQKPSLFYSWMRGLFVSWSVVSVSRLVDEKKRTRSFVRFLIELKVLQNLVTREWYVARWTEAAPHVEKVHARDVATRNFDQCVGHGSAVLSEATLEADRSRLIQACRPVLNFRHERIAHLAESPSPDIPRYSDIDRAISELAQTFQKYSLLLRLTTSNLNPIPQYDWLAIFRVPWLKN